MRSPTVSTFHNMKIVTSPEEIENDRITDSVLDDIKSIIQSTKKKKILRSVLVLFFIYKSLLVFTVTFTTKLFCFKIHACTINTLQVNGPISYKTSTLQPE